LSGIPDCDAEATAWSGYTSLARQAVQVALAEARSRGRSRIEPEHLLLGAVYRPDSMASRALRGLGLSPGDLSAAAAGPVGAAPAGAELPTLSEVGRHLSPRAALVLQRARGEAWRQGCGFIGTEHLFVALVRDPDAPAARLLLAAGATPGAVAAKVALLRDLTATDSAERARADSEAVVPMDQAGPPFTRVRRPEVVGAACFLMASQLFCAGPGWLYLLAGASSSVYSSSWGPGNLILGAQVGWTFLLCGLLVLPLLRGERWGWSGVVALFFVKCAGGLATLVSLPFIVRPAAVWAMVWLVLAAYAAVMFAFTVGLFDARGWYGIGRREGWRTLRAEGLWALLGTAVLELGGTAAVVYEALSLHR